MRREGFITREELKNRYRYIIQADYDMYFIIKIMGRKPIGYITKYNQPIYVYELANDMCLFRGFEVNMGIKFDHNFFIKYNQKAIEIAKFLDSFTCLGNKDLENNFNEMIKEIKLILETLEYFPHHYFGVFDSKIKNYIKASITNLNFYDVRFNNAGNILDFIRDFERNNRKRYKIINNFLILFDNWGRTVKYIVPVDYNLMLECDF